MDNILPAHFPYALFYITCVLNFGAALWMAYYFTLHRQTDIWLVRTTVLFAGLFHAMVVTFVFKHPEFLLHVPRLNWWWLTGVVGLFAIVHSLRPAVIPFPVMRIATYLGAFAAIGGTVYVFNFSGPVYNGQSSFGALATNFGFFAANIAAAVWVVSLSVKASMPSKRALYAVLGLAYGAVVINALWTMQMVGETSY